MAPMVSVIMGVYNCADTLSEAIESLLEQTYRDWELIMCDDGSSDDTYHVAEAYQKRYPDQIILLRHEKNQGLNITLNDCIQVANGKYIARMDGDDISLPTRFEEEMKEFAKDPNLAVVSCPMIYFDENGEWGRGAIKGDGYPNKKSLAKGVVHCHAAAIIKADVMREVGGYSVSEQLLRVEDWHLWIKIYAAGYYGKNIPGCLYMMRDDRDALKRKKLKTSINESRLTLVAVKQLQLPKTYLVYSVRPIIVGLLPKKVYSVLHRLKKRV